MNRKYQLNEFYFHNIKTEDQSYDLGLLYADGGVTSNSEKQRYSICLCLQRGDEKQIQDFLTRLKSNYPIKHITRIKKLKDGSVSISHLSRIDIYSKQMVCDLIKLGCYPRKSKLIHWPSVKQVPEHLQRHFARGIIDGDGNIYQSKRNSLIKLTSNREFCEQFQNWLIEQIPTLNKTKICRDHSMWNTVYCGTHQVSHIGHLLYDNATICFLRKKEIMDIIHQKSDNGIHRPTQKEIDKIVLEYSNGMSILSLTKIHKRSKNTIRTMLKESNSYDLKRSQVYAHK
jgi:hypothetical protein